METLSRRLVSDPKMMREIRELRIVLKSSRVENKLGVILYLWFWHLHLVFLTRQVKGINGNLRQTEFMWIASLTVIFIVFLTFSDKTEGYIFISIDMTFPYFIKVKIHQKNVAQSNDVIKYWRKTKQKYLIDLCNPFKIRIYDILYTHMNMYIYIYV